MAGAGKTSMLKTPLRMNEHSGRESSMAFAFSEQNWGTATRRLTERIKKRTASQISAIVQDAREAPLTLGSKSDAPTMGTMSDQYGDICKFYFYAVS